MVKNDQEPLDETLKSGVSHKSSVKLARLIE